MKTPAAARIRPMGGISPAWRKDVPPPVSRARRRSLALVVLFAAALCFVAYQHAAFGQEPKATEKAKSSESTAGTPQKKGERENMQQLVHDIMAARLARELELDDKETVILIRRLEEFRSQQGGLQRKRQEMLKSLKASLKADAPEADIQKALSELQTLDAKLQELKRTAFEKVGEGMTTTRRAKLYVFYNEFDSEMRRLVQKAREKSAQGRKNPGEPQAGRASESVTLPKEGGK